MIRKIVSGGQTGVDRAALDTAIRFGIAHGGWIPRGRLTENGPLPAKYRMTETSSANYLVRTEKNVVDSDATLIISRGPLTGGSAATREMAVQHDRPWLHIDLRQTDPLRAAADIRDWLANEQTEILNIAGPRASEDPDIYREAAHLLEKVFYPGGAGNLPLATRISKKR